MKYHTCKIGCPTGAGVTLIEMLIVIAIITILMVMVIGIAARIDTQNKEHLAKGTLSLLDAALAQFQDYGYEYKLVANPRNNEPEFYRSLDFPIDCNGLSYNDSRNEWGRAIGSNRGTAEIEIIPSVNHDPCYAGCEVMYFFLNIVPECRQMLDKIDRKLITNLDEIGNPMIVRMAIGSAPAREYPLLRVIDPWGKTFQYNYYDHYNESGSWSSRYDKRMESKKAFPVIISAGPDKTFGTADDIKSRN